MPVAAVCLPLSPSTVSSMPKTSGLSAAEAEIRCSSRRRYAAWELQTARLRTAL
jgi:hypothetical protein